MQYDTTINEWHTCPKSGRINASNPCSEYMFLDDTACNLASLNLMKFYDEAKGEFLVDDFLHAVRIWTIVLELSVLMAQFPSEIVARQSFDFRTLGLGFANIGSLLMVNGIPYDSPEGTTMAGAITAIMTGQAYVTSAELAAELGTFPKYEMNKDDMLRVIRNHRRAAYFADEKEYEKLTIKPLGLNPRYTHDYLVESAKKTWDKALELGEKHGYRNAQVSVIAPTGTIGLVMDCDTTGIEPDFAIVKFKKLAGGGYFKIVNQSVQQALHKLGYSDKQIDDIEKYSKGHGTLIGAPAINYKSLMNKGFTEEKLREVEKMLDNVFDIKFAFNKWTLGEDFCHKLGFSEKMLDSPSFDMLKELGFTDEEIERANDYVCGTMMIEGAPYIKDQHLPIFDTASKCGKNGKRYIPYMAHVRMLAAVQPFVSGAISKTVNMPEEASVEEIGNVYMESWKMMLKAIAIYRDGSKLSQPLTSAHEAGLDEVVMLGDEDTLDETKGPKEVQEQIIANMEQQAVRKKLPKKRDGHIREAYVGGHKVYLRTGEYEDGSLGEIFIDMYKEGASFKGLLNCFAVLTSKALQYGVPLEELVDSFTFTRFEPAGYVDGHEAIKSATSILDYVFRSLGYDYLNITDFVHVKAVDEVAASSSSDNSDEENEVTPSNDTETSADNMKKNESEQTDAKDVNSEEEPSLVEINSNGNDKTNGTAIKFEHTAAAKQIGYTGEQCPSCGSIRVKRNGSCTVCEDCGATTGCS
jgi:ribonucleoside-diphosphate reductase alpha chain